MKFRVWDNTGRVMYYKGFRLSQSGELFHDDWPDDPIPLKDVELMLSTGIKDSKGVEIYQGDVVAQDTGERGLATSLVGEDWVANYLWYAGTSTKNRETLKVLGNKWENPELLKERSG